MTTTRDYAAEYTEARRAWHASDGGMEARAEVARASTRIARAARRAGVELDELGLDEKARRAAGRAAAKKSPRKATAKKVPARKAAAKVVNKGKKCSERGCDRPARARGMCSMHHTKWWRQNVPGALERTREA